MRLPGSGRIRRVAKRMVRRYAAGGLILMYHRIAELDTDPWGLSVSPAHFADHLKILRTCPSVISLPDLVQALRSGHLPRRPIVVTFDDGYADNVETAKPLLERHEIPATVFLTTGAIGGNREFWWDELERVLLEPRDLPQVLDFQRADCSHWCDLGADAISYDKATYFKNRSWRAWEEPPTARHTLYYDLWRRLYPLPHSQKRALLDELLDWAGLEPLMRPSHRSLSLDQVTQLGGSPLIEVGAHTVTHSVLPELPLKSQMEEVLQSKNFLEEVLGRHITSFAYPHGHHDSNTVSVVREAGFTSACTTSSHTVSKQSDGLALPRFQVFDWDGDEFRNRIQEMWGTDAHA